MQAMTENFAPYSEEVRKQILPNELAKLDSSQQLTPQYAQLAADTIAKYGPQMNQANIDLNKQTRLGEADTDLALLKGAGRDITLQGQEIDKLLNPEYYKTREKSAGALGSMIDSLNPDNVGTEAERALAKMNIATGNAGGPASASKTLAGGMVYGDEKLKRMSALNAALQTANQYLPTSRSEFSPINTALNRQANNYSGGINTQQNAGNEAFQAGMNMFNQGSQIQQGYNQGQMSKKTGLDNAAMMMNATGSLLGGL